MLKITQILLDKISNNKTKIDEWFDAKFESNKPTFYNSADLRHNGFKIAPIDTNCFPAGFNNMNENSCQKARQTIQDFLKENYPDAKRVLIIPENHTRNLRYLRNVNALQKIFDCVEVSVGTAAKEDTQITKLDLENGEFLYIHYLIKKSQKIVTIDGFEPDLIILNNDLTDGIPDILQNITTPVIPNPNLGWFNRSKSSHFDIYNDLAKEFCELIDLDPWLISSLHSVCKDVNFKQKIGVDKLADKVEELLAQIAKKYQEYGIKEQPYCYMKADSGTYGMAIMPVFSKADVLEINKKERKKMNMLKGSIPNNSVIIQEGIATIDKINNIVAEPMIYMVNGQIVGNLFRANNDRDEKISLNATNAQFFDIDDLDQNQLQLGCEKQDSIKIYSVIARLAALAAAQENKNINNEN